TLGSGWGPSAIVVQLFSALGMLLVFTFFTGPLLQALSRPHHLAMLEWGRVALTTGALVIAGLIVRHRSVEWQIAGIAGARVLVGALVVTPIYLFIFVALSKVSLREFISSIAPAAW